MPAGQAKRGCLAWESHLPHPAGLLNRLCEVMTGPNPRGHGSSATAWWVCYTAPHTRPGSPHIRPPLGSGPKDRTFCASSGRAYTSRCKASTIKDRTAIGKIARLVPRRGRPYRSQFRKRYETNKAQFMTAVMNWTQCLHHGPWTTVRCLGERPDIARGNLAPCCRADRV